MNKSIPRYLLFKYLRFDKDQPFIMLSKILAFLGVSIGLCVLLVAMAIMNGFDKEFERKLFTMNYPISILPRFGASVDEKLLQDLKNKFPNLLFSPYISTQVIARNDFKLEGGVLFGVNFDDEKKINDVINQALQNKTLQNFDILIGNGLKTEFDLTFDDKITLIFSHLNASGLSLIPQVKRFDVKASFSSGLLAYDKAYMYVDINSLAKILSYPKGVYDGLHVFSKKPFEDIKAIEEFLGAKYLSVGWWEQNGNFFAALALEKRALFIVLMLIILVASLNIVSSLLMIVMNRRSEIALLLSLGVSKNEIKKTFFSLGFLIGGSGIIAGMILATIALYMLGNFDIISLPSDVYGMSKLPLELSLVDFLSTIFGAIFIVALSSYYPAKKATQVNILETLRNE
ncbi:ABC transporter permease [Campylobacter volucris]|uniref:ABC transporter permease n=1 Tax=Campylobacter volucris TaxID=1031542 RepID=A0AAE5YH37_9BACT|nr:ABC transporter permease [Campylobacter volucris]AJC94417.1 lipoprotein releasing system, transmembrane protein, LolC/E family [Campylobacter volucris LMG 24379]KAB0579020.1 ABC transporter permease [Campylobacter volucris]MBF7068523.1 ABC transporter permease [Campylobacter volucris]QBL13227.1 ABC transporter permease [Campylobacter volucris]QEL08634.1 lipoprotein releasing system, transmembrane protein, LolC/E family [Campylobacter volucris]